MTGRRPPASDRHQTLHGTEIVAFPTLLQNLCDERRGGTLSVRGKEKTAFLVLRLGDLAAAYDGDPDGIAKALVRTGALSWDELTELQKFFGATPATLERTLLEQSKVDESAIGEAHAFQIREILGEVLTWRDSRTEFEDGPAPAELARLGLPRHDVAVPTKPALMEATYQLDEWSRLRQLVPSDRDVPLREEGAVGDRDLLAVLDGRRDVSEVIERLPMSRFQGMTALRDAIVAGAVRLRSRAELVGLGNTMRERGADSEQETNKIIRLYERAEELGPLAHELGLWLAEAHERRGELSVASRRFLDLGRWLSRDPNLRAESTHAFQRALELRPGDGHLHRELISTLISQDMREEAALQAEAYVNWTREQGDPVAAIRACRGILEQLSEFEEMCVLLAELNVDAGNVVPAVRLYQTIAKGRLESDEFDLEEKADVLLRILELDPGDLDVRLALARVQVEIDPALVRDTLPALLEELRRSEEEGNDERLLEAYELMAQTDSGVDLTGPRAMAAVEAGDVEMAEGLLSQALEKPGDVSAETVAAFRRLFAAAPGARTHMKLARALLRSVRPAEGVAELRKIATRAERSGNQRLALEAFRMALRHSPFDRANRIALATLLREGGDVPARIKNLHALAAIAEVEGQLNLAAQTLEELVELDSSPSLALRLMECRLKRDGAAAVEALETFVRKSEERGNRGDVDWAKQKARDLGVGEDC